MVEQIDRDKITSELITDIIDNQTGRCRKPGRQTDIQTVTLLNTKTKREPALQIQTCRQTCKLLIKREIDRWIDKQTDRKTMRLTDRYRETDRKTDGFLPNLAKTQIEKVEFK